MKKICFVTTVYFGLEHFMLPIVKQLHETEKFEITFICNYNERFANDLPEWIRYIPVKMKRGYDIGFMKIISKLKKIFKKEKFDIVAYSNENAALYAAVAAYKAKVPIRLYNQWGVRYRNMHKGIKYFLFKIVEKITCKCSTDTRCQSPLHRELCIKEKLFDQNNSKVLGIGGTIGVDFNEYDLTKKDIWNINFREKYSIPSDSFVFGFCGRITKDKGIREILIAFNKLKEEFHEISLLLVGDIDVNNGLNKKIIKAIYNDPQIICVGKLNSDEVKYAYAAMNVYLHPTYREGFGLAIQEAGAMELPVITSKIPGASEVLVEGQSCELVPIKNADQLYQKMQSFVRDPDKAKKMGHEAYLRVKKEFEREKMVAQQTADYIELANRFNEGTQC